MAGSRTASKLAMSIDIANFPGHDGSAFCYGLAPHGRQSSTLALRQGDKRLKNLQIFSCNILARNRGRWGEHYARCQDGMLYGAILKAVARKGPKVICAVVADMVTWAACRTRRIP